MTVFITHFLTGYSNQSSVLCEAEIYANNMLTTKRANMVMFTILATVVLRVVALDE